MLKYLRGLRMVQDLLESGVHALGLPDLLGRAGVVAGIRRRRLLGVEGSYGEGLGLTNDWAYRIIKAVGNYGEIFERNVGQGSPIKISRGLNALWNKGGLQYAPPIR